METKVPQDFCRGSLSLSDALHQAIVARERGKPVQQPQPVVSSQDLCRQTAGRLASAHGKSSQP